MPTPDDNLLQDVDILVVDADMVTLDEKNTVIRDGAVAVDQGRIVWVGPSSQATTRFRGRSVLNGSGMLLLPGMIDAHFHTAQQLLRGKLVEMSRRSPLKIPVWKNYLVPFESVLQPEDVYLSGLLAYANMIRVGTTCFAEAGGPHPDEMGRAALEIGIRGFIALSTIDQSSAIGMDVPASMRSTPNSALESNVALVQRWRKEDRVKAWFSLRQIIVCSPGLITEISRAARELDVKIHTHLCEGIYEIDFAAEKYGRRPTEFLQDLGVLSHHLHCAHSVLLAPQEVDLYQEYRLSACHCAFNNYSIGPHRLTEMWRRGIDIGLGTDGPAGFGSLDMFQVAHGARIGQQAVCGSPFHVRVPISSEELLRVVVNGGARALGMYDEIGSIEVGKRADFILTAATEVDQMPFYEPLYVAANVTVGRDVRTVVVDGKIVMKDRELTTIDLDELKARLQQRQPIIMERFERLVA